MVSLRRPMLGQCPVCGGKMYVARLQCNSCNSTLEGRFDTCRFCQLNPEQLLFIEVFLGARGNIKEVERELGISYPTVRSRLDSVLQSLGYKTDQAAEEDRRSRQEILEAIDAGEMTVEQATKILKEM
jgi:hypothetical protein